MTDYPTLPFYVVIECILEISGYPWSIFIYTWNIWEISWYILYIKKISIYHEISGYLWNIWISMKYLDIHEVFWYIHEISGKYPHISFLLRKYPYTMKYIGIWEISGYPWNIWISMKYPDIHKISEKYPKVSRYIYKINIWLYMENMIFLIVLG